MGRALASQPGCRERHSGILCEQRGGFFLELAHLFDEFPSSVDGAVVDHVHNGYSKVTADSKGNAETQSAHDGDDISPR